MRAIRQCRIRPHDLAMVLLVLLAWPESVRAQTTFIPSLEGDHYFFQPSGPVRNVLVIAHGTRIRNTTVQQTAQRYLTRWTAFAEVHDLALIVPVFDDARFGNGGGGYGGYRGLFGKVVPADEFVIALVRAHQVTLGLPQKPFYLYGHSAGGQFAIRFLVQHPELIAGVVATAPGRFSYPTLSVNWPYGARRLSREILWGDGTRQLVNRVGDLARYAKAAAAIFVIVGSEDLAPQPARPAHEGRTRIDLAKSWVAAMNHNAVKYGFDAGARVEIVPGIGHSSRGLTLAAQDHLESLFAMTEDFQSVPVDN